MPGIELVKAFLEQASASGTKANVLKPMNWMILTLIAAVIAMFKIGVPIWISILIITFMVISIIIFLFAFLYCLFKDRDALRSEKYSIQKMAIEKGFVGDNIYGRISQEFLRSLSLQENDVYEVGEKK